MFTFRRRPEHGFAYILVAPACLMLGLLFAAPVLRILWLSVAEPRLGLENYGTLLASATVHRIAATTLRMGVLTTALTVVFGYVVAYALAHARARETRLMLFCILLAFWLSILVRSLSWVLLLRNEGPINELLLWLHLIRRPLTLARSEFGVAVGMVHVMMPLAIMPMYTAFRGIDQRLVSAAHGLGCGPVRSFVWVYLPLSMPGVAAATVLVFIFSLGFFITPALLGGGRVIMIAEYIRAQFEETLRWGLAAALAAALLAAVLAALALSARFVWFNRAFGGS